MESKHIYDDEMKSLCIEMFYYIVKYVRKKSLSIFPKIKNAFEYNKVRYLYLNITRRITSIFFE